MEPGHFTMFLDRDRAADRAAKELARVCRPGGRVRATEFFWRRPPTAEARELYMGQVGPGMRLDTVEEWLHIFSNAGLKETQTAGGPFAMMTAREFLSGEGSNALAVMARLMTRPTYLRKMAWLMPRMARAVPHLGYLVVSARKPSHSARPERVGPTGH